MARVTSAPPITRMRPGDVWEVLIMLRFNPMQCKFGQDVERTERALAMIVQGEPNWPRSKYGENLWFTDPKIGNLSRREEPEVWKDLWKLRMAERPYYKNYRRNMRRNRGHPLLWQYAIDWKYYE